MLNDFQKVLLKMLTWLTAYLENNNYKYYVIGGTMLGAVRHKGFIPWDDDIDIGMPRPDYERLMKSFEETEDYLLETPFDGTNDFLYSYCKFYNKKTTLIERQRKNVKRGLYIDIFPLDGLGNTKDEAISFLHKVDRKNMFLMTRTCAIRKQRKWYKNVGIFLSRLIPSFLVNNKKLSLKIDKLSKSKKYEECSFVGNVNGSYRERECLPKDFLGEPTDYAFENIKVKGPEKADEFLTQIYHDWRKLPPVEKRGIQHDFVFCDLEKPFKE